MSSLPVAVFVGGTSGIGRAMAEAFARRTNGDAHIIIVGRNKASADDLIASFPKPTDSNAIHEFIASDVSLISNVHNTTAVLLQRLERIDYLVLSSGVLIFAGRNETSEGLDDKMALSYYSRWTFIHDLLPLLRQSVQGARVYTVLASGPNTPIEKDNLDLKKNHTLGKMTAALTTYTNVAFQKLAKDEPRIHSLNHAFRASWYWKIPYYIVYPVFSFLSITPEAAGNIHLDALMDSPAGFNSYDPKGKLMSYTPADEETVESCGIILWN
ncbi:hypothetical protein BT96DRAFT_931232 [Gymnopus androsaceus JB14]|uniref:NAD(P)-binding protein n=1 Tax=Gymnopus androsaceus JB14 TaxID=1447944 RepID=A0A6A4IQX4_9AGAR|nr:hypothetical protein BT96DRAFT_931232 [Gymnopus androsaceus JB14]